MSSITKWNVLFLGSGGREHALYQKCLSSPKAGTFYVSPGNAGFPESSLVPGEPLWKDISKLNQFISDKAIDLLVIGPEEPLVLGIADKVSIPCFGPSAYCAQIEGSKSFAKDLMKKAKVPTANHHSFTSYDEASLYLDEQPLPIVVKADGLAAGKGVLVSSNLAEAKIFLKEIFIENKFSQTNPKVVIESFLIGEEASLFVITDGDKYKLFPAAQDHKRAFDGDLGPNTGGMGAYAPAPIVTPSITQKIVEQIIKPVIKEFQNQGQPYKGLLYVGLMIDPQGDPFVVEFNCRFGDPETQCLMHLVDCDLLELFYSVASTGLPDSDFIPIKKMHTAVVVVASKGYPDNPRKNDVLVIPPIPLNINLYHAGTKMLANGKIVTNGGRVFGVVSTAENLGNALQNIYNYIDLWNSDFLFYRKDIGNKALCL